MIGQHLEQTIQVESTLCKVKTNEKPHYAVNLGVHSKRSIIEWLLAALFFSQRGLKALENQMFKLAGEGVYNNFPSDGYCTLQKALQAEAVCWWAANKLKIFSVLKTYTFFFFLHNSYHDSGIFNWYNPQVRRCAI